MRTKIHSHKLVEYTEIPANIGTILHNLGIGKPGYPAGAGLRLTEESGKDYDEFSQNNSHYYYGEADDHEYIGLWHWHMVNPEHSSLYVMGEYPSIQQTTFDFVTYVNYLESLRDVILRIEASKQINNVGLKQVIDNLLIPTGKPAIPSGPAVNIYLATKLLSDTWCGDCNQTGAMDDLTRIYKEFAGVDYESTIPDRVPMRIQ